MKEIIRVELENFQSHEHSVFDLCENVNIFAGPSNNGKSSVIRAIEWLLTNKTTGFTGIRYVSNWAKHRKKSGPYAIDPDKACSVSLVFIGDDGKKHTVTRKRTNSDNLYIIDNKILSAVGTGLPAEVAALLNISDLNIQEQDDTYFLFNESPGNIASRLNQLVHLESIDKTFKIINEEKRELGTEIKVAERNNIENANAIKQLEYIPELKYKIIDANKLWEDHENVIKNINDINKDMESIAEIQNDINTFSDIDNLSVFIKDMQQLMITNKSCLVYKNEIEKLLSSIITYKNNFKNLPFVDETEILYVKDLSEKKDRLIKDINKIRTEMRDINKVFINYENIELPNNIDLEKMTSLYENKNNVESMLNVLTIDLNNYIKTVQDFNKLKIELIQLKKELPDVCPVCGAVLNK